MQNRGCWRWAAVLACLLLAPQGQSPVIGAAAAGYSARVRPLLPPDGGAYFGVAADIKTVGVEAYTRQLGEVPASYVLFCDMPFLSEDKAFLNSIMPQITASKAFALLTVEPNNGLQAITDAALADFVAELAKHEANGASIIVRFAHEMNGAWYIWGQQPQLYRATFRRVAAAIYKATKRATMLWAPNSGGGYPFIVGQSYINCKFTGNVSADCLELDTNGDKELTVADDMYTPFYPGDDVVDWVGMSIYHFGQDYPYGLNVDPEPAKYVGLIEGKYNGLQGDYRAVLDFYERFCTAGSHDKPMVVGETAAFYNLCNIPGTTSRCAQQDIPPTERHLKEAWWTQVFNVRGPGTNGPDVAAAFPNLKLVHWFDIVKPEVEAQGNIVSWSISADADIRSAFLNYLGLPRRFANGTEANSRYWHFAPGSNATTVAASCTTDPTSCQPFDTVLLQEGFEGQATVFRQQVNDTVDARGEYDFQATGAAAHSGSFGARVVVSKKGQQPWDVQLAAPLLNLVAGNIYRATAWLKAGRPTTAYMSFVAGAPTYTLLPGTNVAMRLTTTYQQFELTFAAPSSGVYFLTIDAGGAPVGVGVIIDDVVVTTRPPFLE